jgi:hypothetical protein
MRTSAPSRSKSRGGIARLLNRPPVCIVRIFAQPVRIAPIIERPNSG